MAQPPRGMLSVVATPIGNLEDITLRALRVLQSADLILAEDTRHSRKLCTHHAIHTPLRALHAHSAPSVIAHFVEELERGKRLALITDAGTPLVSDPGQALVREARARGLGVESLPGPSAVTAALCVAGFDFDAFRFVGFLPRTGKKRRQALERIIADPDVCVLFEAPPRLDKTLRDLQALAPARRIAVCRELTKLHEEVVRGTPGELLQHFAEGVRGELTLVLERDESEAPVAEPGDALDEAIRQRLDAGMSPRDVAAELALALSLPRRQVYARVLTLRGEA
jgi:16S rRNA (cytidine1402-2'-O)-methyltransferase